MLTATPDDEAPGPGKELPPRGTPSTSSPPKGRPSKGNKDSIVYGLLLLPALVLVLVVIAYPLLLSVWNSIFRNEQGQQAYVWIAENAVYIQILGNTLETAVLTALCCLLLGYPYAYLMVVVGPALRSILTLCVLIPFWISGLVRIFAWVILLQTGGPVATVFPFLGDEGLLHSQAAVQIGLVQVLLPFMILPLFNSLRTVDQRLMVAAESMGARRSTAFFRVFLPLSAPGIYAGTLLVFMLTLGFYVLPQILGSPSTSMIGSVIYTQTSQLNNVGRAGALSLVLLACAGVIILAAFALTRLVPTARRAR
jgi:putative spermidine/putrescine transport system permease protein